METRIAEHTREALEYDKVVARIVGHCLTPYGRREAAGLLPLTEPAAIERRLDETTQMMEIQRFGLPFPLSRLEDCTEALERSRLEGARLDPAEILQVAELAAVTIALHRYDREGREKFPAIAAYLERLRAFPELLADIRRCLDEHGEVKDNASPRLKSVRAEQAEVRRKIIARLERILGQRKKQAGWQDDMVMQRNGRYVIPVIAGQYHPGMGILHDRSQSGNTLYVEPNETVELNNRLNFLQQEEQLEIDRILRRLTADIGQRAAALMENTRLVGILDARHAAARLGVELHAARPRIQRQPMLHLEEARHPLLLMQAADRRRVVPLSVRLEKDRYGLLITGPNTGGKTVALKTIGLLVLMAQAGLPIPADERSSVGIFSRIFADIGDEQSIEQSLSTFSSHMRHIVEAVEHADDHSLVLLDEIGAGTDPKEGAALAEAIILNLIERGVFLVATTHYSQLKTLPLSQPALENASLEFDRKTLSPTFRLQLGIPGSSYAVEIASRLGMPESICRKASELVGSGERSLAELIASLEDELAQLRRDRTELEDRLRTARDLEARYQEQVQRLEKEADAEKEKLLAETERLLTTTRREVERLVAEIRRSQAERDTVRELHQALSRTEKQLHAEQEKLRERRRAERENVVFEAGDTVRVLSLNQVGEIDELLDRERARVRFGTMTSVVPLRDLEPVTSAGSRRAATSGVRLPSADDVPPEIHLRGMTVEEALEALERYLDRAVLAGLSRVYVIHGKGTGTLRRVLTDYLKSRPEVDSVQLGNWNEGGAGVTVVTLKT